MHNNSLPILLLCGCFVVNFAQSASPDGVVAWGYNGYGQTTVPVAAQSGVTAIAAGFSHNQALLGSLPIRPTLNSRRTGDELILTWPTNAVGFTLQSMLQLTPPMTWADVTNAPSVILGGHWTVTNTFSGGAKFYRLRKL